MKPKKSPIGCGILKLLWIRNFRLNSLLPCTSHIKAILSPIWKAYFLKPMCLLHLAEKGVSNGPIGKPGKISVQHNDDNKTKEG
jgi:hypothetical protein